MSSQVTLSFSNITNNNVPCKDPIILIVGSSGNLSFPCGDKIDANGNIKISIPESEFSGNCISFVVKCSECDHCPEEEGTVCLCNDSNDCQGCEQCIDGICVSKCKDNESCIENTCCECSSNLDCGPGFYCDGCKCRCNGKVDTNGNCVECLSTTDCGPCQNCINGNCTDIICPNNLVCIGSSCGCAPGSKYDVASNSCVPADECFKDGDCAECETCFANNCVPIVCPEGYKCVGGECVYWPCSNTSCSNGADCGKDCGCLDGECVPCYILECTGQCQEALGCKCDSNNKCEPVNNCGQYCDGSTPCLDSNCTCYNNECVSCENFPCTPDECSDKYNCGCDNGECGGGKGCNDKFELKKNTSCSLDGCELVATYTTDGGCSCDPIEFKIKNIYSVPGLQLDGPLTPSPTPNRLMTLQINLFKNNVPYENFKVHSSMGDDEIVDAVIKTTVTHKVDGVVVNPSATQINPVSVDSLNKVPFIFVNNENVIRQFNGKGTTVTIEVRAENVKVNSNNCINYKSKIIAVYELDFRSTASTNTTISKINNSFKNEISNKLNDNTSKRKPLFIWFKSNTGNFNLTKYINNGIYNQSGFFRKEYGVNNGTAWTSKINNPARQTQLNQTNELWNNLNYRAIVDCGCGGGSGSTLQNVVFCCTENIDYTISNCGKTITIPPFNVCSVNKNLTSLSSSSYTIPQESQTNFWMIINGNTEKLLRVGGGEIINAPYVYNHDSNISSVAFEQRYNGNPLTETSCREEYSEEYNGPDYNISTQCGKITVNKISSSPTIQSVTGKKGTANITFVSSAGGTVWTSTNPILSNGGEFEVTVNFQGSCSYTKFVTVVCNPEIDAVATDEFARAECVGGVNPNIVVSVVSGFVNPTFSINGVDYLPSDPNSSPAKRTFTNLPAGTYTLYAKEIINGVEVIKTDSVTIKPVLKPTLSKVDICGNTPGSITILGAAPTSTWKIFGPAFNGFTVSIGVNGNSTPIQVPIDKEGQYTVQLFNDPTSSTCSGNLITTIMKGGGIISPGIVTERTNVCNDGELFFRIDDGGLNLSYNISLSSSAGGQIQDLNGNTISTLQANNSGIYTAKVVGLNNSTSPSSYTIRITGIINNTCFLLENGIVSTTYTVQPGPKITNALVSCHTYLGRDYYDVIASVSGVTTSVNIGGEAGIFVAPGVWRVYELYAPISPILISAINIATGCADTFEVNNLPDCDSRNSCTEQTVSISASPASPTCGPSTVSIYFGYTSLGDIDGSEYLWYKTTNGIMQLLTSGTITASTIPPLNVTSSPTFEEYVLVIRTINGVCEYTSNAVEVFSQSALSPEIFGAGISPDTTVLVTGNTYSYSTAFIQFATYTWTLTNANGSNQPIGTNSNVIQISSFTEGLNIIDLTVSDGICTGTTSAELVVGLTCPTANLLLLGSTGGCQHIQAYFTSPGLQPGITISNWEWQVSYDNGANWISTSQTGAGTIVNFNPIEVYAGEVVDVRVEITLSNSCNFYSSEIEYTRCNCVCSNPANQNTNCSPTASSLYSGIGVTIPRVRDIGYYQTGDLFDWELGFDGTSPIRFIFKMNGVAFRDTGIISRMTSAGGCNTGSCPVGTQYLGDTPAAPVIMGPGLTQLTGTTSALETVEGCDRLTAVGSQKIFISGTNMSIPSDGLLTVEINTFSATGCGTYTALYTFKLTCV